jgi:hypothetical protein
MAISGPTLLGSAFARNQTANTPLSFNAAASVPAGSFVVLLWGTDAPDTATCQVTDAAANSWVQMVQSTDPSATALMTNVFICQVANQINAGQAISMQCSVRASYGGAAYRFDGSHGSLTGSLVKWSREWAATPQAPNGQIFARTGQSIFAALAVGGPATDLFTQDAAFGADQTVSASGFNMTLHATARHNVPGDANYSYAPTLNATRQGTMVLLSFS